ncbi:DNA-binding protein [Enterobacter cancerogenus]|uniref:DNA-binding protein n=1 Tax=Enterobacter cancerogenus TaxID=69218 RepID=UPI004058890F
MTTLSPDTVRRIEDAAAALIAAGTPNPTNEQVRQHLGGSSLSHISPVMREFRARQPEQADDDIARADQKRDEALAKVAALESELAVLREVVAKRDRLLQEVRKLRAEARLIATGEHLAAQLQDTKAELKEAREDGRKLQAELLTLARAEPKGGKVTK